MVIIITHNIMIISMVIKSQPYLNECIIEVITTLI